MQGTREEVRTRITPECTIENNFPLAAEGIEHEEPSPLVLAQKRKMIRETSRTLELLKKEFAEETTAQNATIEEVESRTVAERSPSLIITKFDNKNIDNNKVVEGSTSGKSSKPPPLPSANTYVKSIGKKDINVLDTIFGTSPSHGKRKRQRELNNFKPVIDVPSQDIPKIQKRSNKKTSKPFVTAKSSSTPKPKYDPDPTKFEKKQQMHPPKAPPSKKLKPSTESASEPESPKLPVIQEGSPIHQAVKETASAPTLEPIQNESPPATTEIPIMNNNIDTSNTSYDSTTIVAPSSNRTPFSLNNAFTDKLQEQIYSSITLFSNELFRKMNIINKELNLKIVKELSEKYQNLFQELQTSFHNDTEEMSNFVSEIRDMLNLPEEELVRFIRTRKFGSQSQRKNE